MPPSPGRAPLAVGRSPRLPFAGHRLTVLAATLLVALALVVALAGGVGGMLMADPGTTPVAFAPTMPAGGAAIEPAATASPAVARSAAPATPTPTPTPTPSPTALPTPTPLAEPRSDPPEKLTGYVWPLRNARLTSRFGPRADGFLLIDGQRVHDGMDLATFCGDKIRAAHGGIVLYAGRKFDPYLGYSEPLNDFYARITNLMNLPIVVVIDDGNGYRSVYAHLSVAQVGAGDVVKAGQVIGLEGATGRASGCHLHYSLIRMDGPWQDVAPNFHRLYPPRVRERVDPFIVLPLDHPHAPARLRNRHAATPAPHEPPPPRVGGDE